MLLTTIRQVESVAIEVKGEGLPEVQEQLEKNRPEGFVLVQAPVTMKKGETAITALGTYARRDATREVEGSSYAELRAAAPAGWQMLSVRRV
ncbi:hypothetical protein Leucomu_13600 [Leucobacter muris]|uniref:DUF4440 domain-containing protein n=1 Tax=Leucobacter muris TaxID=1935379 RepID=A0ABX5QIN4_9MICO|nr:hypothetical protein [Leucobacter muris]QAB18808.1 hypothetical protein Leucomu_13600 [Leucobacter muris]